MLEEEENVDTNPLMAYDMNTISCLEYLVVEGPNLKPSKERKPKQAHDDSMMSTLIF